MHGTPIQFIFSSQSVGGLVEGKTPKEICALIAKGEIEIKE